jgi:hypothetical protein
MPLPFALKGIDVAIATVFHTLGLKIDVCPIFAFENGDEEE